MEAVKVGGGTAKKSLKPRKGSNTLRKAGRWRYGAHTAPTDVAQPTGSEGLLTCVCRWTAEPGNPGGKD